MMFLLLVADVRLFGPASPGAKNQQLVVETGVRATRAVKATQTTCHDAQHPSALVIPELEARR